MTLYFVAERPALDGAFAGEFTANRDRAEGILEYVRWVDDKSLSGPNARRHSPERMPKGKLYSVEVRAQPKLSRPRRRK